MLNSNSLSLSIDPLLPVMIFTVTEINIDYLVNAEFLLMCLTRTEQYYRYVIIA